MTDSDRGPWAGRRRTRESNFGVKQDAVLDRAAAMFAERGYGAVSLSELADSLNITKPTLYYYFASKDALILEIQRRAQEAIVEGIEVAEGVKGAGRDKFEHFLRHFLQVATSDYTRCLYTVNPKDLSPGSQKKIQVRARDAEDRIQALMAEGMEDGSLRRQNVKFAYQAIFGMLNSIGIWYKERGPVRHDEMVEQVIGLVFNGIGTGRT